MQNLEIKKLQANYQEYFWSENYKTIDLISIFNEIKSEKHIEIANKLTLLYNSGNKEEYTINKKRLPVVSFCGIFEGGRKKENLKNYNQILIIDIDKLGTEELQRVKIILQNEPLVYAFWESPSRDGVKGIVFLNYEFDYNEIGVNLSHKLAFRNLTLYFQEKHQIDLDVSGSDFTRLCFICHDNNLIVKDEFKRFNIEYDEIKTLDKVKKKVIQNRCIDFNSKAILYNPFGKNNQKNKTTIKHIIKYLSINQKSITYSYENWLKVAFAISSSFTFDIGLRYFQDLCKIDKDKYNPNECETFLMDCYDVSKGSVSFSTIIYLAVEQGFIIKEKNVKSS